MGAGCSVVLILAAAVLAIVMHTISLNRNRCLHHWHPADAMITWKCCHCERDTDGLPANDTTRCMYAERQPHEWP